VKIIASNVEKSCCILIGKPLWKFFYVTAGTEGAAITVQTLSLLFETLSVSSQFMFDAEDRKMPKSCYLLEILCAAALTSAGCHHNSANPSTSDPAQDQFAQAFLTAHDNKDLDAEEKLVDWDDVTESSRNHFIGEFKSGMAVKIAARVESLPTVPPGFSARYNIPPEKFLVVVYDDPRGAITVKFPIAKKDGRYYFAMRKE